MSASELHRRLVGHLADAAERELGPSSDIHADHRLDLYWPTPPSLGEVRPDVFGRRKAPPVVVIGEAKTGKDIENRHTEAQLECYFAYLKSEVSGELWLAVPWADLDTMYFLAYRCRRLADAPSVRFRVHGLAWEQTRVCKTLLG